MRWLTLFLAPIVLAACAKTRVPVNISFSPQLNGHVIACSDTGVSLSDLRFFVSDVAFVDASGSRHPVPLLRDDRWQTRDVALLDFENGQGSCLNGTAETNSVVRGTVAEGDYVGLSFTVGVPFALNHANPLRAEAPLNDAAMHWHWRSGYKFMRAGVATSDDGFWLHLGSTGCKGTVGNISGCSAPNRVVVEVAAQPGPEQSLSIELSALLESVDLTDQESSDCSSGPAESACDRTFDALGLDFAADGKPREQQLFRLRR